MIATPRHVANEPLGDVRWSDVLPSIPGWDLAAAATRVSRHGADPRRLALSLAAALAADEAVSTDADLTRAVIALAAWRAGSLALRVDALSRLGRLLDAGEVAVAGAALGLDPEAVPEFAARQASDRFWWPGRDAVHGYVCAVGGFAGLGGAWIEPPEDGCVLAVSEGSPRNGSPLAPAVFGVRSGDTWWRIDADVWGSRLAKTGAASPLRLAPGAVSVVTRPDTYLAWIHVQDRP